VSGLPLDHPNQEFWIVLTTLRVFEEFPHTSTRGNNVLISIILEKYNNNNNNKMTKMETMKRYKKI
jgi:hypothetical protein